MPAIVSAAKPQAVKVVIYGPEGIGKSTFAAQFPDPVFIDTEGSTKYMDVKRFDVGNVWGAILDDAEYVRDHPGCCRTLVLDTADWAEQACMRNVCIKAGKHSIEDFAYGKGYTFVADEFQKLLAYFDLLIEHGVNVVVTAHAKMRKYEQPDEMGSYDRWEMKLSRQVAPLIKEWADMLLFANYETVVVRTQDGKNKAQGGRRVMYTSHHPCWDAKNRMGLPDKLDLSFSAIASAVPDGKPTPVFDVSEAPDDWPERATLEDLADDLPEGPGDPVPEKEPVTPLGKLFRLMKKDGITPSQVETAVTMRGFMPAKKKLEDYPQDFVQQVLVDSWDAVLKFIKEG